MNLYLSVIVLVLTASGSHVGQNPPAMTLGGTMTLPLAAQASRVHLLGAVELYTLAVYAEGGPLNRERLVSVDTPKALRIQVTYDRVAHEKALRSPVAVDWRGELVPRLEGPAMANLRATFLPLQYGDVINIEYLPRKGTFVRVNSLRAVEGGHHDVMLAFLDNWLGQRPVSEEMKRALLGLP